MGNAVTDSTRDMYAVADRLDAKAYSKHFAPDGELTFGNGPTMKGPKAVEAGCEGFFATIQGMHHNILNEWAVGRETIVELEVTYTRLDGEKVPIPVVSIWSTNDAGLIERFRVYFDLAPVFS